MASLGGDGLLSRIRIVLSRPSHPGNIGAAARAMRVMGLRRLFLVAPQRFPDAQADAMAAGATDVLTGARVVASLPEALAGTRWAVAMTARRRELAVPPLWARDAAVRVVESLRSAGQPHGDAADIAVVFGHETSGLSNQDLALCRHWAQIPVDADFRSLNLAAAVQVMAYELRQAAIDPGAPPAVSGAGLAADHEEFERLIEHFERAAIGCGFLDPAKPRRLVPRLRRLFARAVVEKEEVNILRGLLAMLEEPRPRV